MSWKNWTFLHSPENMCDSPFLIKFEPCSSSKNFATDVFLWTFLTCCFFNVVQLVGSKLATYFLLFNQPTSMYLKVLTVTPLFKAGEKDDLSDYRPISVLPWTLCNLVFKKANLQISSRTIAPEENCPSDNCPWTIVPEDNCPRGNMPPENRSLTIKFPPKNNCPHSSKFPSKGTTSELRKICIVYEYYCPLLNNHSTKKYFSRRQIRSKKWLTSIYLRQVLTKPCRTSLIREHLSLNASWFSYARTQKNTFFEKLIRKKIQKNFIVNNNDNIRVRYLPSF